MKLIDHRTKETIYEAEYADMRKLLEKAVAERKELHYADLHKVNLYGADLAHADLPYTDLKRANLSYANLSYANLSYTDLRYANLADADLSCTTLSNTNIFGADLRYVKLAENVTVKATTWRRYTAISNVGSRNDTLHLFNTNAGIFVKTGCFSGTVDKFMAKVEASHGKTRYAQDYAAAIAFAKQYFKE